MSILTFCVKLLFRIILECKTKCSTYKLQNVIYNILYNTKKERAFNMANFKIPAATTSTPKSIRFPDTVINRVEDAIKGTDCTFSAFVVASVENALSEME